MLVEFYNSYNFINTTINVNKLIKTHIDTFDRGGFRGGGGCFGC